MLLLDNGCLCTRHAGLLISKYGERIRKIGLQFRNMAACQPHHAGSPPLSHPLCIQQIAETVGAIFSFAYFNVFLFVSSHVFFLFDHDPQSLRRRHRMTQHRSVPFFSRSGAVRNVEEIGLWSSFLSLTCRRRISLLCLDPGTCQGLPHGR
ncbi:hypothetical protein BCR34DRAFT_137844 [Clohesyomyces aquaticus]|uniref:Uncharacterized protein n=1 Tax=Clohesyomyces aquaticus TaxID=1231657 RepID=A0A1Y2A114_9PLEO|nr:hypothetical protein BCR34DRAFT_137844 [Clohesyomyces aquaticus]